mmetsp:Transcript_43207/g.116903  ORF Transcript_43207/g.116903 Transcript_43207/m.116903 type:complete len:200 (+) Transcript_43207:2174-2773(+)
MEATTDEITQFTSSDSSPLKVMNRRRLAEREQESVAIEHTSEDSQGGEEDCARGVTVPTRAKSPSVPYTRNGQEYLRHRPGDVKYGRLTELVYPPLEVSKGAPEHRRHQDCKSRHQDCRSRARRSLDQSGVDADDEDSQEKEAVHDLGPPSRGRKRSRRGRSRSPSRPVRRRADHAHDSSASARGGDALPSAPSLPTPR